MFFEGRNVPLFDFLDTLSLSFIYKNERRQRCHDQKNNSKRASISAPIDWTRVVPLIYKQYEKSFDADIEKMFVKAIVDMLNGNAEEVYCGVAVLYFQILMEESSRAPFCVDRESLIKIASQTIRENEEQLKSIKKWGGQSSKNGLWDEIQRYKKLFISKFGIVI